MESGSRRGHEQILDLAKAVEELLIGPLFDLMQEANHWLEQRGDSADLSSKQRLLLNQGLEEALSEYSIDKISAASDELALELSRVAGMVSDIADLSGIQSRFSAICYDLHRSLPTLHEGASRGRSGSPNPESVRALALKLDQLTDDLVDLCYLLGLSWEAVERAGSSPRLMTVPTVQSPSDQQGLPAEHGGPSNSVPSATGARYDDADGSDSLSRTAGAEKTPLPDRARSVRDLLLSLPGDGALTGGEISSQLSERGVHMSEEHVRQVIRKVRQELGIEHRPGAGYYIPVSKRGFSKRA